MFIYTEKRGNALDSDAAYPVNIRPGSLDAACDHYLDIPQRGGENYPSFHGVCSLAHGAKAYRSAPETAHESLSNAYESLFKYRCGQAAKRL